MEQDNKKSVRVASVQFASKMGDKEYNRAKLSKLCEEAAAKGANIIVLPETCITGYLSQDIKTNWRLPERGLDPAFQDSIDPSGYAETCPGPSTEYFEELAKHLSVYITVPFLEVDNSDKKFSKVLQHCLFSLSTRKNCCTLSQK